MLALTSMVSQVQSPSEQACDALQRPLGAQSPGRQSAFEPTAAGWIFPSARFCARHLRTWRRPFAMRSKPLCAKRRQDEFAIHDLESHFADKLRTSGPMPATEDD